MFAEHMDASGLSRTEWAKRLGVSKSYLSQLASGQKRPSLDMAVRIERETDGAVRPCDWIEAPALDEDAA